MCIRQTRSKFSSSSAVFIGDSRLRYLFNATVKHITGTEPVYPKGKHNDLSVTDEGLNLTMKFYWKPFVNEDMQKQLESSKEEMNRDGSVPFLILVSSGTWTMKTTNASEAAFKEYKQNLTDLAPMLDEIGKKTRVLWVLQDPVFERLLSSDRAMIDNSQISKYNWAAEVRVLSIQIVLVLVLSLIKAYVKCSRMLEFVQVEGRAKLLVVIIYFIVCTLNI